MFESRNRYGMASGQLTQLPHLLSRLCERKQMTHGKTAKRLNLAGVSVRTLSYDVDTSGRSTTQLVSSVKC